MAKDWIHYDKLWRDPRYKGAITRYNRIKLDYNTYLHKEGEEYIVRLYGSAILSFLPGRVTISMCGYSTYLTVVRINRFSDYSIGRCFRNAYLYVNGEDYIVKGEMEVIPFFDLVIYNGKVQTPVDMDEERKAYRRMLYKERKAWRTK